MKALHEQVTVIVLAYVSIVRIKVAMGVAEDGCSGHVVGGQVRRIVTAHLPLLEHHHLPRSFHRNL